MVANLRSDVKARRENNLKIEWNEQYLACAFQLGGEPNVTLWDGFQEKQVDNRRIRNKHGEFKRISILNIVVFT